MPKKENRVTAYLEPDLLERFRKLKAIRAKLIKPGYKSDSEYIAHLIEYGLKTEEQELQDTQNKVVKSQKVEKEE